MPIKRFPLQEECDPTNPEEHFLWALVQIPYGPKQTQPVQANVARVMSKHLHELGFRHHPKLQTKRLHLPQRGQKSIYNGSAIWGPMDSEPPEDIEATLPNVDSMTKEERDLLDRELDKHRPRTAAAPTEGVAKETSWREVRSRHVKKAGEVIENGRNPGDQSTE